MKSYLLATLASGACLLASVAIAADPVYRVKAVPSPTGQEIRGMSINNRGHIAGVFEGDNGNHVFLYRNGTITDLGVVAGEVSEVSLNDKDEIVGTGARSFLWRRGTFKDLSSLGVQTARDINNRGQIVGRTTDGYAYRLSHGELERFGMPGEWSESWEINDQGQVTGSMNRPGDTAFHAFLYDRGTVREIGPAYESYASTINERGQVGLVYYDDFFGSVAIYHRGVTSPRIWSLADPTDINNAGDLLGYFYRSFPGDPSGPVLLYKDGATYWVQWQIEGDPLNRDFFLSGAGGINDRGQIVANGQLREEPGWFFILTPIPQPATAQAGN